MNNVKLFFDHAGCLTTFKCNLKCKHCCTGSPYRKNVEHFEIELLFKSFENFFRLVEFVRNFSLGGGEPFLRSELPLIIEEIYKYENKFELLEIITNGTILPGAELLHTLVKHKKVFVLLDHYGSLSVHAEEISDILTKNGVRHSVRKYHGEDAHCGGWADMGDFSFRQNVINVYERYRKCFFSHYRRDCDPLIVMTAGVLHQCVRALNAYHRGIVDNEYNEYIDILDGRKSDEQLKKEIFHLMWTRGLKACAHCNGICDDSPRVMPAIQLTQSEIEHESF
jgi:hypothetical protein